MIIAIDVGGTKTLLTAFDAHGAHAQLVRFPTPHDTQEFFQILTSHLDMLAPQATDTIAAAAPGLINTTEGIIVKSPNLGWRDFSFKPLLTERYHCTTLLENDAHLAGLGAVRALPEAPQLALYVTIGTGIGSGIVIRGKLDPAFSHSEAGHMVFQTENGLQNWEEFASGRAIKRVYGKLAADITNTETWQEITSQLTVGFRALIPILQPDIVLIGGGVGAQFKRFGALLEQRLRQELPEFIAMPKIIQASNPEEAVLYGCYYYAIDSTNARRVA
jgi:predicted NBD/HSP70 family sugar kinase